MYAKPKVSAVQTRMKTAQHRAENSNTGVNHKILNIDKDQLPQEAQSWAPNQSVNWAQLGRRYGLTTPNSGQVIKEYLAEQGITAACEYQRTQRAQRRPKKQLPGGKVSFPMYQPVNTLKQRVQGKINSGEICTGEGIATTTIPRYIAQDGQEMIEVNARKIRLTEIRKRLCQPQIAWRGHLHGRNASVTDFLCSSRLRDSKHSLLLSIKCAWSPSELDNRPRICI